MKRLGVSQKNIKGRYKLKRIFVCVCLGQKKDRVQAIITFIFFVLYFDMRHSLMTWKRLLAGVSYSV